MATIKSYTDLQQSKVLLEILPLESADMHYNNASIKGVNYVDEYRAELMAYNDAIKVLSKYMINPLFEVIPCWSLAALLNIINTIKGWYPGIEAQVNEDKLWQICMFSYETGCDTDLSSVEEELVDACYEVIVKLHEFKML